MRQKIFGFLPTFSRLGNWNEFHCSRLNKKVLLLSVLMLAMPSFAVEYFGTPLFKIGNLMYKTIGNAENKEVTVAAEDPSLVPEELKLEPIVTDPNTGISYTVVEVCGYGGFKACTNLKTIVIPSSVTHIGMYGFQNCANLETVIIKESQYVRNLDLQCFDGCNSLKTIICYATTTPTVNTNAFKNVDRSNVNVIVPQSALSDYQTHAQWGQFSNIYGLGENNVIYYTSTDGNVVTPNANNFGGANIVSNTYADGQGMIVFDADVSQIGEESFLGCYINSIVLPNTVTRICNKAFRESSISKIFIDENVTNIDGGAFWKCYSLSEITCMSPTPPELGAFSFYDVPVTTIIVKVPSGAVDLYKSDNGWKGFINIVGLSQTFPIVDGEVYDRSVQINGVGITYTRTFKNDAWQPLYIPFSLEHNEWSEVADVAEISGVHEYDDGTTLIEFRTVTSGATNPNTPYLIRGKQSSDEAVVLNLEDKTLCAAPAVNGSVWCASTRRRYTLTGVYEAQSGLEGSLVMSGGTFYTVVSPATTLKAQRFYLSITDEDHGYGTTPTPAAAPRFVGVMVDGEVTGIEGLKIDGLTNDNCLFNLSGQKVGADYKGIVIRNGKKYLMK